VPWVAADQVLDEVEEFLTGARPAPHADRVLTTLLFTDIVGSTQHAQELGDRRWRELLDAHHALVRRELARFRGREVDTAGDGFFATFDGPARAVRAACAIRDGVRPLGLEIRAGVHTGECELAKERYEASRYMLPPASPGVQARVRCSHPQPCAISSQARGSHSPRPAAPN
jgi:class 3 adenylate cyclase